jgi:ABC-type protease/lipase transport system fused ATPase/permease subunit
MRLHVFAVGPGPASGEPLPLGAWLVIHNEASAGVIIASSILVSRALAPAELTWMTSQAPSASTPDCRAMRNTLEPAP